MNDSQGILFYGDENKTLGDKFVALVLALAPLLQHYKGIVENAGFTVLLLITPILFLRTFEMFRKSAVNRRCLFAVVPLIIFFFYTVLIRDFNVMRLGYVLLLTWIFICVAGGCINISLFFKYATWVALLATAAIVIQYLFHYVLGRTIDFRPLSLLVSQNVIWVRTASSYGAAGLMYRPSGFFLEPSHFFLYTFPLVTVLLLSPNKTKKDFRHSMLISLGLLLSTSGMGIAFVVGIWMIYLLIYRGVNYTGLSAFRQVKVRNIAILVLFVALVFVAYQFIPFFQNSVDRVFTEDETTNAIDGRVRLAENFARGISGRAVWFGTPNVIGDLDFNVSGFFATYIKFGVLGLLFSYWFYLRGVFKLKRAYFWMTLIIVVVSYFSAHTHGTFYMLYFVLFLMNGYYGRDQSGGLMYQEVVE